MEQAVVRGNQIAISAITLAEVVYLSEKNRIAKDTFSKLQNALIEENTSLIEIPVDWRITQAMFNISRLSVPDMPDRIIAATALHLQVPLITRDRKIQLANLETVW